MKIIAQWKLWAICIFITLICYYLVNLGWTFSLGIGLFIALLTQFINGRSVNKSYRALIEDNYLVAKEHGYKIVSIGRDLGIRTYQLEKEIEVDTEDILSIKMYIKRAIVSVHYVPVTAENIMKDAVYIISSENYALDTNDIKAIEEHADGTRISIPSLK